MSRRTVIVVISSLAVGGPQKSLIGLLERLDLAAFDVTLLVLDGKVGPLSAWVPSGITVKFPPPAITAATLPRGSSLGSARWFIRIAPYRQFGRLLWLFACAIVARGGRQVVRQRLWSTLAGSLPKITGHYDLAIGILGLSTYCVVDLIDADRKFHWIRSDVRMLGRNRQLDAHYYRQLTGFVAVSEAVKKIFQETYPELAGSFIRGYKNDIPAGRMDPRLAAELTRLSSGGAIKIASIARLDPLKGLEMAARACKLLADSGIDARWLVAGEGPFRAALEAEVQGMGIGERFALVGEVSNPSQLLEWADIFVHPSRAEGRSNSVEEAKAFGTPVIVTDYPTARSQIADGVTGLVCEMSPEGIAQAVKALAYDEDLRERLVTSARTEHAREVDDPNGLLNELLKVC